MNVPERVLVFTELTFTVPVPPTVLLTLLTKALPLRFTRLRKPPPLTLTRPPSSEPASATVPTCTVPALLIAVPPVKVLTFVKIVVPAPVWAKEPTPLMTPDTVWLPAALIPRTVPLSRTLFAKVLPPARFRSRKAAGFTVTALPTFRLPAPAICRTPARTLVGPV